MSYSPYVSSSKIIERLQNLVTISGDSGAFNSFQEQSGGAKISTSLLLEFQAEAEQMVCKKLETLYKMPLTSSVTGGITLDDFVDGTKYVLQGLFISATCIRILDFVFPQQAIKSKMLKDVLEKRYEDLLGLVEKTDQTDGRVYPAFEDLVPSKMYMRRDDNIVTQYSPPDNAVTKFFTNWGSGL